MKLGLDWLRGRKRRVRRAGWRIPEVETLCLERLETRCLLTATQGAVVEFPSDFLSSAFAEHNGIVYVNGRVGSNVGPDVYYELAQSESGELQLPSQAVQLETGINAYREPLILRDEVVFLGFGSIGDGQFRAVYRDLTGNVVGLPHPIPEFGNSSPLAANVSGVIAVAGANSTFITDLREEEIAYVLLPVSPGPIGTVSALSETGLHVFGQDAAGIGPSVIWRRQVDSQTDQVSYVQMVLAPPSEENSLISIYRPNSITDHFATTSYGVENLETFEITSYVGLWRSSDASFVRGFEGGLNPFIAEYEDRNYLFFNAADPDDPLKQIVFVHVEGADNARPLSQFLAENNVVFGDSDRIDALERVQEVQISDAGVLMILGTRHNSDNQEVAIFVRAQLAAVDVPAEPQSVQLPAGGGDYELTVESGQLIVREAGGPALLSRGLDSVSALTIVGSDQADRVTVVGDVSAADIPITVLGGLGHDLVDLADYPGFATVDLGAGDDVLRRRVAPQLALGAEDAGISVAERLSYVGGLGFDSLSVEGADGELDLVSLVAEGALRDVEELDLRGVGHQVLTLNRSAVQNLSSTSNTLVVRRDYGDTVDRGSGWSVRRSEILNGQAFSVFVNGAATLKVQELSNINLDDDGNLRIDDASAAGRADRLKLSLDRTGQTLVIEEASQPLTTSIGSRVSSRRVEVPLSSIPGGRLIVSLGAGDDRLDLTRLPAGVLTIEAHGGGGRDTLFGSAGNDQLFGDAGSDNLNGNAGNDLLLGGTGNDTLSGDDGQDSLLGGAGNDSLRGGDDADVLLGENGNDTLRGERGQDTLAGGSGTDRLSDTTAVIDETFTLPDELLLGLL